MTFECPVLLKLRPWYAAVDDALEELARERGDGACKSRACRTRDTAPAVWPNLQTSADVLGRLEVELGDFAGWSFVSKRPELVPLIARMIWSIG